MKPFHLTLIVPLLLGSCVVQELSRAKLSGQAKSAVAPAGNRQAQAYSGYYYQGDGLGYNVSLQLGPDGLYTGEWRGCMGVYGTARGTWRVTGQHIVLKPDEETDMMKGHLRSLDIVRYQKKTVLVPTSERKKFSQWLSRFPRFEAASILYFIKKK